MSREGGEGKNKGKKKGKKKKKNDILKRERDRVKDEAMGTKYRRK
jgi:hypothetical protein